MWNPPQFDLITSTPGIWSFYFEYNGDKEINRIEKSCDKCTSLSWVGKQVVAKINIEPLGQGKTERISNKKLTVHYKDGSIDVLSVNMILKANL